MSEAPNNEPFEALLCSECFEDHGLSLDAHSLGLKTDAPCPHCGSPTGRKLDRDSLLALADTFFVRGTLVRAEYGARPGRSAANTMAPPENTSLHDLARRLRDLVNRTRRHARLWRGPRRNWHVITSALDMLQDTAWALETYATEVDGLDEDKPHAYIRIFGVLNGLVLENRTGRGFPKRPPPSSIRVKKGTKYRAGLPEETRTRTLPHAKRRFAPITMAWIE